MSARQVMEAHRFERTSLVGLFERTSLVGLTACLCATACGGPGGAAASPEPRAIVVAPAHGAAAPAAPPEPGAPAGDESAAIDVGLGADNKLCARVSGRVYCTADFGPDRALTSTPPLEGIEDAVHLAVGRDFGCVATRAGGVLCFGDNTYGQLGAKLRAGRSDKPVAVVGVTAAKRVVAGDAHACALLGDGSVRCWGRNDSGQTGGSTSYLPAARELVTAEPVEGVKDVKTLAAGSASTCALGRTQEVTCWGRAVLGRDDALGSPRQNERPTVVAELARFDDLAASDGAFCGIRSGEVFCWGQTSSLLKGSASGASKLVSANVTRARRVRVARSHACALLVDGAVTCWGANHHGALGRGETAGFDALAPAIVRGLPFVTDLAVGGSMSCAISGAREVYCWGSWPHAGRGERKEPIPIKIRVTDG